MVLRASLKKGARHAGKFPNDLELQRLTMAQKCAYLIKIYNILESLVICNRRDDLVDRLLEGIYFQRIEGVDEGQLFPSSCLIHPGKLH